jgi:cyclopropane-fatty-acyl-phospholipid synthase
MLPWASQRGGGFIDRYIFPDGELPPIAEVIGAAERAGFTVRHVESLRHHYAHTVMLWLDRLEKNFDLAVALVGRERARAFRLYLMASAAAFHLGRIDVFHLLLAKRDAGGHAAPSCRARRQRSTAP